MTCGSAKSAVCLGLAFALLPALAAQPDTKKSPTTLNGKVVRLADVVKKDETKVDDDAAPLTLVLQTPDGKLYPLVKDEGSRMFYKDAKLLNRPMRLLGRFVPKSEIFQVLNVQSVVKGQLHEVYYWCDVCTIRRFEAGNCDCCGAPMDFRETLVKQ